MVIPAQLLRIYDSVTNALSFNLYNLDTFISLFNEDKFCYD